VVQARDGAVDGILVESASRTGFPKVAQAAVAAGMAWVVLNGEPDYLKELRASSNVPSFAVSADNHEIGRIQGRQLGAILPGSGAALYIQGPSHSTVTEQRTAGMLETKPGGLNVRILKSANWTEEAGFHAVESWLRLSTARQEHIDVVQAQNDLLAVGARRAIEAQPVAPGEIRRPLVPFLGVDGLPRTGQAWVRQGILVATIIVPPTTSHALNALVAALRERIHQPERTLIAPESFPAAEALTALSSKRASAGEAAKATSQE
jgi:ABC-type sugar transport system substrate-binding protein